MLKIAYKGITKSYYHHHYWMKEDIKLYFPFVEKKRTSNSQFYSKLNQHINLEMQQMFYQEHTKCLRKFIINKSPLIRVFKDTLHQEK